MNNEIFYKTIEEILGVQIEYKEIIIQPRVDRVTGQIYQPLSNKNRWNNRNPGNGRIPGYGLIRKHGSLIYLCFHSPVSVSKQFKSDDELFEFLIKLMEDKKMQEAKN